MMTFVRLHPKWPVLIIFAAFLLLILGGRSQAGESQSGVDKEIDKAVELTKAKDYVEAVRILKEALKRSPKNGDIYYQFGLTFLKAGERDGAAAAFSLAYDANKNDHQAASALGSLMFEAKKMHRAFRCFARAAEIKTDCDYIGMAALSAEKIGQRYDYLLYRHDFRNVHHCCEAGKARRIGGYPTLCDALEPPDGKSSEGSPLPTGAGGSYSTTRGGPVHVRGFFRSNGTWVKSFDRAAKGFGTSTRGGRR